MVSIKDTQEKIQTLQQQELELASKEKEEIVAEVKEKIVTYHITAEDLGFKLGSQKTSTKRSLPPKYKTPPSGKSRSDFHAPLQSALSLFRDQSQAHE